MKLSKKAITALSFAVGACVFVSTAFADMALGTGYDRLKNAVKHTAAQMEDGLPNYTTELTAILKADGQIVHEVFETSKVDNVKRAEEHTTVSKEFEGEADTRYQYSDTAVTIWKPGKDDTYYVTEYLRGKEWQAFENPFKEDIAQEIEKIVDALVGNLKDYVQAEETSEGGKIYSGSLSSAQVPALVNAVSSFALKQIIRETSRTDQDAKLPAIEKDIFLNKVSGTAVENKAGLLENVTGEATLTGKDRDGASHDITLSFAFKLRDIGSTKLNKPDLTGAKVEKTPTVAFGFDSRHVGVYKSNIVMETKGKFVKIGERTLEIIRVEDGKVTGKYYETIKPEYAAEYPAPYNFEFESDAANSRYAAVFTYTNANGQHETGQLHPAAPGKVYLDLNITLLDEGYQTSDKPMLYFDGELIRVFEE